MNIFLKNTCFEYFLFKVFAWRKELMPVESLPITRISALKLLFLAAAVKNSGKTDLLDIFDNFYAMQYGPVESDVYNTIQNGALTIFRVDGAYIFPARDSEAFPVIESTMRKRIDDSIEILKQLNPNLAKLTSSQLVEITHKWNCWRQANEVAELMNKGSFPMTINSIRTSNSVFK